MSHGYHNGRLYHSTDSILYIGTNVIEPDARKRFLNYSFMKFYLDFVSIKSYDIKIPSNLIECYPAIVQKSLFPG